MHVGMHAYTYVCVHVFVDVVSLCIHACIEGWMAEMTTTLMTQSARVDIGFRALRPKVYRPAARGLRLHPCCGFLLRWSAGRENVVSSWPGGLIYQNPEPKTLNPISPKPQAPNPIIFYTLEALLKPQTQILSEVSSAGELSNEIVFRYYFWVLLFRVLG